ncbi:hypothetical protein ES702_06919 [subsurface metagenome]
MPKIRSGGWILDDKSAAIGYDPTREVIKVAEEKREESELEFNVREILEMIEELQEKLEKIRKEQATRGEYKEQLEQIQLELQSIKRPIG